MKTAPTQVFYSVPVRRTRWPSLLIASAALVVSALASASLCGLLMLSSDEIGGTLVVIMFGLLWWGGFFFSFPWQRRMARSLDARHPGISVNGGVLTVPLSDGTTLSFMLDEPHEMRFGWSEAVVATVAAPTMHTRSVLTYATLSQVGRRVFLKAEDSARAAQAAGWPRAEGVTPPGPAVRLWADDLVALVETVRTHAS